MTDIATLFGTTLDPESNPLTNRKAYLVSIVVINELLHNYLNAGFTKNEAIRNLRATWRISGIGNDWPNWRCLRRYFYLGRAIVLFDSIINGDWSGSWWDFFQPWVRDEFN